MYSRIGKNARLGDGCMSKTSPSGNAFVTFMSTDKEVLEFKKKLCDNEELAHLKFGTQMSGYGGTKTIWNFRVRANEKLTVVHDLPIDELIKSLDEIDIYLWLIDDGSWHKNQNLFHLYCNMLDDRETNLLIDQIEKLFGIRPTMRKDRKRDGRSFNYLYFPRKLTLIVRPRFKAYLDENKLDSMMYKVGGSNYRDIVEELSNEAIMNVNLRSLTNAIAGAKRSGTVPKLYETTRNVHVSWTQSNGFQERIISKESA